MPVGHQYSNDKTIITVTGETTYRLLIYPYLRYEVSRSCSRQPLLDINLGCSRLSSNLESAGSLSYHMLKIVETCKIFKTLCWKIVKPTENLLWMDEIVRLSVEKINSKHQVTLQQKCFWLVGGNVLCQEGRGLLARRAGARWPSVAGNCVVSQ